MAEHKPQVKEVRAFARYVHVSPQKLRLVADLIRNIRVDEALEQLNFSAKKAALPLAKAINSAVANAQHNFDLKRENLYIKTLTIDPGPVFKRYAPRAQGRAFLERKRTSHINVVLGTKDNSSKRQRASLIKFAKKPAYPSTEPKDLKQEIVAGQAESDEQQSFQKPAPKPRERIKKNLVDLKRRLFNRKSGS